MFHPVEPHKQFQHFYFTTTQKTRLPRKALKNSSISLPGTQQENLKMEKNTKVKLTEKWWKDNKAKTLRDSANLGAALKAFEKVCDQALKAKGMEALPLLRDALDACDDLDARAKQTAGNCVAKLHGESKHVLTNTFPAEVDSERKALKKAQKSIKKDIEDLSIEKIMKDRVYFLLFSKFLKKNGKIDHLDYLVQYKKKNDYIYNNFIKKGAKMDIPADEFRKDFDDAYANGKLKDAPWEDLADIVKYHLEATRLERFTEDLLKDA